MESWLKMFISHCEASKTVNLSQLLDHDGDACAAMSVLTVCLLIHFAYIICRIMKHNLYLYPPINISYFACQETKDKDKRCVLSLNCCSLSKFFNIKPETTNKTTN